MKGNTADVKYGFFSFYDDAIKNMGVGQISMTTEKLYQGNERNLLKIFGSVNEEQLEGAIDKISVRQ